MSNLLNFPLFQAIDGNGNPIRGGLLYTYEAGTSTAKYAYSDRSCSTAHANPVVLDSEGRKEIYLKGNYKLNLKTSAGAQVPGWPVDNVEGVDQSTLGYYYPSSGAADQGVTGDSNTIKYCVDTIAANAGTIFLAHTKGSASTTYTLGTSETIPANVTLIVEPGAVISVSAAQTLTINGKLDAGLGQIFAGTGTVVFGTNIPVVYPEWWYSGSGAYDTALQAALDCTAGPITVTLLPNKTYALVTGVTVKYHRSWIIGGGKNSTIITFTPTGTASCITFDLTGASAGVQCGIRGIGFTGAGDQIKTAIELVNTEEVTIEDIAVGTWTDATYACIGIHSKGKHMAKIRNNTISADIPIQISQNTNRATEGNIDCDHYWLENNYLISDNRGATSTNANILIDSGVNLTNLKIDGGAWHLGGYGLKWVDTGTSQAGINMSIKNVRYEQNTYADGYILDIEHNFALQNLTIENLYGGQDSKGVKLSKVVYASFKNYEYVGSTTAMEVDANTRPVVLSNCFIVGGTLTMTGLTKIFDSGLSTAAGIASALVIYDTPALLSFLSIGANVYPGTDDTYYLGKNDDDTPFAWKGLILKDQGNGKYYRIELINGTVTPTDLTD